MKTRLSGLACALLMIARALQAQTATIDMQHYRTRWTVDAVVAGKTRKFIFDTGGGVTSLSPALAEATGCKPWGRMTGFQMFGGRLDSPRCDNVPITLAGTRYVLPTVGLLDFPKLNPADSSLDGLLALNVFDQRAITLDLANGHIIVESEKSLKQRVHDMKSLPMRIKREAEGIGLAVVVGVPTSKGLIWLELDSGNGGTILVSKPVAELVGLNPAQSGKQQADFEITDGVRVHSGDAFTPDMIMDGNLGMPFLRNWLVTLDLKAGRAWIGPLKAS